MASSSTSALLRRVGSALVKAAVSRSTTTQRSRRCPGVGPPPRRACRPRAPRRTAATSPAASRSPTPRAPTATPTRARSCGRGCPTRRTTRQGKDRPVLVVGRVDGDLLGLMLTSKDHDRRQGPDDHRRCLDLGSGDWDRRAAPARCGSTACCGSPRPPCAARVRRSTGPGSTRSPPRCATPSAGRAPSPGCVRAAPGDVSWHQVQPVFHRRDRSRWRSRWRVPTMSRCRSTTRATPTSPAGCRAASWRAASLSTSAPRRPTCAACCAAT